MNVDHSAANAGSCVVEVPPADVTRIGSPTESGDPSASDQLLPLVDGELRRLAANRLVREKPGQTLQATALVQGASAAGDDDFGSARTSARIGNAFAEASLQMLTG